MKEKKPCETPGCPMMGKSRRWRGKSKGYRRFCQFHSHPRNRGKYHPTQKIDE